MSILIGLHIKRTLEKDPDVAGFVGDRIFPIVMPQGVSTFPYICYDTNGQSGQRTKDGLVNDSASVSMGVIAKTYEDALVIANSVRKAFDGKRTKYNEFSVKCKGVSYNDEYLSDFDAFAVNLNFDFETTDL